MATVVVSTPDSDTTVAIQAAIDRASAGDTIQIPEGIHRTTGIYLKSNITLEVVGTLQMIPTSEQWYSVVSVLGCDNVHIVGPGLIQGERDGHVIKTPTDVLAGHGHGINVGISRNVSIIGVTVSHCWGDGIYVQGATGVEVNGITSQFNRRQGLSVTQVNGLQILYSTFSNISGAAPSAGIDMEPDMDSQTIANVTVKGCHFHDTIGPSIMVGSPHGTFHNIVIEGNTFDMKTRPIWTSERGGGGKPVTPLWAVGLKEIFKGWSGYRWWGYPTQYTLT